jgi:hypothetical protein
MAELYVKNSLNASKAVRFNVSLSEYTLTNTKDGERVWLLDVGTTYLDALGNKIPPRFIHNVSKENIDQEIESVVSDMCKLIDWETLEKDDSPPFIVSALPYGPNVDIHSLIQVKLSDAFPTSGLDLSALKMILNNGEVDFDITDQCRVVGDPFEYTIEWQPRQIVLNRYN